MDTFAQLKERFGYIIDDFYYYAVAGRKTHTDEATAHLDPVAAACGSQTPFLTKGKVHRKLPKRILVPKSIPGLSELEVSAIKTKLDNIAMYDPQIKIEYDIVPTAEDREANPGTLVMDFFTAQKLFQSQSSNEPFSAINLDLDHFLELSNDEQKLVLQNYQQQPIAITLTDNLIEKLKSLGPILAKLNITAINFDGFIRLEKYATAKGNLLLNFILTNFPHLKSLNLTASNFNASNLQDMLKHPEALAKLEELNLSENDLAQFDLFKLLNACQNLQRLKLNDCNLAGYEQNLSDYQTSSVPALDLSGDHSCNEETTLNFLKRFTKLTKLSFHNYSFSKNLDNLAKLIPVCQNLEEISLPSLPTEKGLDFLSKLFALPNCNSLRLGTNFFKLLPGQNVTPGEKALTIINLLELTRHSYDKDTTKQHHALTTRCRFEKIDLDTVYLQSINLFAYLGLCNILHINNVELKNDKGQIKLLLAALAKIDTVIIDKVSDSDYEDLQTFRDTAAQLGSTAQIYNLKSLMVSISTNDLFSQSTRPGNYELEEITDGLPTFLCNDLHLDRFTSPQELEEIRSLLSKKTPLIKKLMLDHVNIYNWNTSIPSLSQLDIESSFGDERFNNLIEIFDLLSHFPKLTSFNLTLNNFDIAKPNQRDQDYNFPTIKNISIRLDGKSSATNRMIFLLDYMLQFPNVQKITINFGFVTEELLDLDSIPPLEFKSLDTLILNNKPPIRHRLDKTALKPNPQNEILATLYLLKACPNLHKVFYDGQWYFNKGTGSNTLKHLKDDLEAKAQSIKPENSAKPVTAAESFRAESLSETYIGIDAETKTDPKTKISTISYFSNPEISLSSYRLDLCVWNSELNNGTFKKIASAPETLVHQPKLEPFSAAAVKDQNLERGTIELRSDTWVKLPSLSRYEQLKFITFFDKAGNPIEGEYDLRRNSTTGFYYIKPINFAVSQFYGEFYLAHTQQLTIKPNAEALEAFNSLKHELLKSNPESLSPEKYLILFANLLIKYSKRDLTKLFLILQQYFLEFGNDDLENVTPESNLFGLILQQKKGSCRHRAKTFAFIIWYLGIKDDCIRIVINDCHEFIEFKLVTKDGARWYTLELGGHKYEVIEVPTVNLQTSEQLQQALPAKTTATSNFEYPIIDIPNLEGFVAEKEQCHTLFLVNNEQAAKQLFLTLLKILVKQQKLFFSVTKPEDLKFRESLRVSKTQLSKVPGELLHFVTTLKSDAAKTGVLLINFDTFNSTDLEASSNCLAGKIGKEQLPSNAFTFSIMVKSRFEQLQKADDPFVTKALSSMILQVNTDECATVLAPSAIQNHTTDPITCGSKTEDLTIDCFDGDFTEQLSYNLKFAPDGLSCEKAENSSHTDTTAPRQIILNNPLQDPEHILRCQIFNITKQLWRDVVPEGEPQTLTIPADCRVCFSKTPYLFSGTVTILEAKDVTADFHLINSSTIDFLFDAFEIKDDGHFVNTPGILAKFSRQEVPVKILVTQNLPEASWTTILATAKKLAINLEIYAYKDVQIPLGFITKNTVCETAGTSGVCAAEPTTLTSAPTSVKDAIRIYITEQTTFSDLVYHLENITDKSSDGSPMFAPTCGVLFDQLLAGKTVILDGKVSPELQADLETLCLPNPYLLLYGKKIPVSGRLLFTNANKNFSSNYQNSITASDVVQKTIAPVSLTVKPDITADEFESQRTILILGQLKNNPVVNLVGETATGKSYYIKKILPQIQQIVMPKIKVFDGFVNLKSWAEDSKPDSTKILFIDEANLADPADLSILLGIYGKPPQIFIKGKVYPLTANHKIVLAGNPSHYGNRELPYFDRFKMPIITLPTFLPDDYLQQKVLGEVFANVAFLTPEQASLAQAKIFAAYKNLLKFGLTGITSRNLQMMALHFLVKISKTQTISDKIINQLANDAVWLEAQFHLANKNNEQSLTQDLHSKIQPPTIPLTASYNDALDAQLALRALKQKYPQELGQFGSRGVTIQGPADIDKTTLVIKTLENKGFINADHDPDNHISANQKFWCINSQMDLAKLESILNNCYQNGGIILLEDSDAAFATIFEAQLNALLQAETLPKIEGFLLIQIQDSDTQLISSKAAKNRQMLCKVNTPTEAETQAAVTAMHPTQRVLALQTLELLKQSSAIFENNLRTQYNILDQRKISQLKCLHLAAKNSNQQSIYKFVTSMLELQPASLVSSAMFPPAVAPTPPSPKLGNTPAPAPETLPVLDFADSRFYCHTTC